MRRWGGASLANNADVSMASGIQVKRFESIKLKAVDRQVLATDTLPECVDVLRVNVGAFVHDIPQNTPIKFWHSFFSAQTLSFSASQSLP